MARTISSGAVPLWATSRRDVVVKPLRRRKGGTMKRLFAFVFLLTFAAINGHFSKTVFGLITAAAAQLDRGETFPSLPGVAATDKLQIARGGQRPSGLWIVCSEGPQIRLALNTRLPIEEEFARNGTRSESRARLIVLAENIRTFQAIKNAPSILFQEAMWRRDDENDVVLTSSLSAEEISILSRAFSPAPPAVVRIDVAETGTEMRGTADGGAIAEFATHCLTRE